MIKKTTTIVPTLPTSGGEDSTNTGQSPAASFFASTMRSAVSALNARAAGLITAAMFCLSLSPASAVTTYSDVPVIASASATLGTPGNSKNAVFSPDGSIYLVYKDSSGVFVVKSSNRGQSFSTPTLVTNAAAGAEVEVKVGPEGNVYVAYKVGSSLMFARSTDGAATFETPTTVATVSGTAFHLTAGSTGIFIVTNGSSSARVYSNLNLGVGAFTAAPFAAPAFADVFVAPDGEVIVGWDNPSVFVNRSSDDGATFSASVATGAQAYYSTMATCFTATQRYLYIGGASSSPSSRYDLTTGTRITMPTTIVATAANLRQLAADNIGNVVSLTQPTNGGALSYQVSTDFGVTFGTPVAITPTATSADVALNAATGDLVVVYLSGGTIFATTTAGELATAPEITVTESGNAVNDNGSLSFGSTSVGSAVTKTFTITNSGTGPLTLANLAAPSGFAIAQNFGSTTLAANGGTTTFQIRMEAGAAGTPTGSVTFTNNDGDESPFDIEVSGTVIAVPMNAAPTNISLSNASIAENNAPGATIGTLTATDADITDTHTFELVTPVSGNRARNIVSGNDNAAFTITGNVLSINDAADFEAKSSYTIRVRTTDSGNPVQSFEKDLIIDVTDVTLPQTIDFAPLAGKTFGDASFAVSASGGASGQAVTFSIVGGPASISGNIVTLTGAGDVTVRASQAAGGDYSAAPDVEQTFNVAKGVQTIVFNPPATAFPAAPVTLSATGGASGNAVTFEVIDGPGSLSGNVLAFSGEGDVLVRASQAGNANFNAAPDVERTIVVALAVPVTTGNIYSGLLTDGTGKIRGSFHARLNSIGAGTVTVWVDGRNAGARTLGVTTLTIRVGGTPMTVNFPAGPISVTGHATRTVTLSTGSETLEGVAPRSPFENRLRTPRAGKFTFAATSATATPPLAAVMSGNLTSFGGIRITARLGNGRVATFTSQEQGDGTIAVYCGYGIGGVQSLSGTLAFTSNTAPQITGNLRWTVPAGVDARLAAGVDADYESIGARYRSGSVDTLLALDPSKQITLGLEIPTLTPSISSYTFPMTANLIPFLPNRPYARVVFFPGTGMFSGTTAFDSKPRNFYGVLLQGEGLNYGVGYLQDVGALGTVSIEPQLLR